MLDICGCDDFSVGISECGDVGVSGVVGVGLWDNGSWRDLVGSSGL